MLIAPADVREWDGGPNHSCEPTLAWSDDVTLVAVRDLAAGEELTVDYSLSVDDPDFVMWCHCETYRCRQAIEGTDWRIPQLQTRYAGWWAPRIQQRIDTEGAEPAQTSGSLTPPARGAAAMLSTAPPGARTKNRRMPHASVVSGWTIS